MMVFFCKHSIILGIHSSNFQGVVYNLPVNLRGGKPSEAAGWGFGDFDGHQVVLFGACPPFVVQLDVLKSGNDEKNSHHPKKNIFFW